MNNIFSSLSHIIAITTALIGIVYLLWPRKKSQGRSRNKGYDVLIGLGLIWFTAGLVSRNWGIWPIGLIILLGGLAGKLKKNLTGRTLFSQDRIECSFLQIKGREKEVPS